MRQLVCFLAALAALGPQAATAQMQPHRGEYALRLGAAANAPRIGTAVQDITQDCGGWRLKRDIATEIAITPSWKLNLQSKLDSEELRNGNGLRFRTRQNQNGNEREVTGKLQRAGKELRAELVTPNGPQQFTLPSSTLMPVGSIDHLIERLRARAASFPALAFDTEVISDAFLVEVSELDPGVLRGARPGERAVAVPGRSWPVFMSFTRGRDQQQRPLFTLKTQLFDSGVLERLTVETGLVTVTADLVGLEMRKPPTCPRS
ncbi:MAG TPA: DUF1849 family protein [Reyranella sp.]|nr:DUF1849 family protein [Reyranella sp.]